MLFNSSYFIFIFLPIVVFFFYAITGKFSVTASILWLFICSLFFYAWWDASFVLVLLLSICTNYSLSLLIVASLSKNNRAARLFFIAGILFNLSLIGYFKYSNFIVNNVNLFFNNNLALDNVILPLGISFFTFQQIAYLSDCYRGTIKPSKILPYSLFVSFFPQLVAGPIVRFQTITPQLTSKYLSKLNYVNLSKGLSFFIIGLFKKVILADTIAVISNAVFHQASIGNPVGLYHSWAGALAYTFQLYFDFSGYCDMAIGLGLLFNIKLPVNFNSPYKATSVIDFWRRWHITLSYFLRDYLYIPLGGNRKGLNRRNANLMATMLLCGLWHGASWTFIAWGGLHGILILINHAYRYLTTKFNFLECFNRNALLSRSITFITVTFAWVLFRAESFQATSIIWNGMLGFYGVEPQLPYYWLTLLVALALIVFGAPNSQTYLRYDSPSKVGLQQYNTIFSKLNWKPSLLHFLFIGLLLVTALGAMVRNVTEFLYYQF